MEKKRGRFTGTAKVYRFSLAQMFKGKANQILLVILVLFSLFMIPVSALVTGGSLRRSGSTRISRVRLYNETFYELGLPEEEPYQGIELEVYEEAMPEQIAQELGKTEAAVSVRKDQKQGYRILAVSGPESEISQEELAAFSDAVRAAFEQTRFVALGARADQLEILGKPYQVRVKTASKYLEGSGADLDTRFAVQYFYAIVVLMVSSFTVSYIVRSVIEEKASRLVELLMVSVRPLALLAGKILAMMTYILIVFALLAAGMGLSWGISRRYLDLSPMQKMMEMAGIRPSLLRLDVRTAVAVLVSIVLAYLLFSVLSGLAGTCCSAMEEAEAANMQVVLIELAGYLGSLAGMGAGETGAVILSLCPVVSAFAAPAHYLLGTISGQVLLLSWALQGVLILLLFGFTARVYDGLLLHKGGRIRIGKLISMAGKGRETR